VTDHYADGTCQWWHLSRPSPELIAAGQRNDVDEAVIGRTFAGWQIERLTRTEVPSDTRKLDVLLARMATR
jgi:hypothetical protein